MPWRPLTVAGTGGGAAWPVDGAGVAALPARAGTRGEPAAEPGTRAPWLDRPLDGETVTDPLVVTGRLRRRDPRRLLPGGRGLPNLELDGEALPALGGALVDGARFVATVRVPHLAEGVHALSLARGGRRGPGWSLRMVHFVRAPAPAGSDLVATARTAVSRLVPRRTRTVEVRIDGRPWPEVEWLCGYRERDGWTGVAVADLRALPPGRYDLEIEPAGLPPAGYRLLRLAGRLRS